MAKDKNSFVLYTDLLETVSKLPDNKAGKLFKIILEYVNDNNPTVEDVLIQVAFEPIKQQLKRDLKKWEKERSNRSDAGKIGGIRSGEARRSKTKQNEALLQNAKQTEANTKQNEANEAVTVNVSVNDTVIVNDIQNTVFNKNFCEPISEIEIGATREFVSITLHREYTPERIMQLFAAFQIQTEKKFYTSRAEKINHFRNWIKTQPYDTNQQNFGKSGTNHRKSAGAHQLAGLLKTELTSLEHTGGPDNSR